MTELIRIAHRGASACWPENTLLAFRKALEVGASWLELDVQLSRDGELVVIHDEALERTTNGRGPVGHYALADLRRLDAGQGEPIPQLVEVLDLVAGRAQLNIELKGKGTGEAVARLLQQRADAGRLPADEILVSSLDEDELTLFAGQRRQVRVAPVADLPNAQTWELAERLNAWSLHVEVGAVSAALVAQAAEQGRKLLVYTVNDRATLEHLQGLGVAGIFTDRPEFLAPQPASKIVWHI